MTYITLNLTRESLAEDTVIRYKPLSMSMDMLISWGQDLVEVLNRSPKGEICRILYDLSHPGVSMQFLVLTNRDVFKPGFTDLGFRRVQQILDKNPQFNIKLAVVLSNKGTGELASKYVKSFDHPAISHKLFFDHDKALEWLTAMPMTLQEVTNPTRQIDQERLQAVSSTHTPETAPHPFADRAEVALLVDESIEYLRLDGELTAVLGRSSLNLEAYGTKANTVSRKHAMLQVAGGYLYVIDLNSTNGTFINGQQLEPMKPYLLNRNDQLHIGALNMQVIFRNEVL
jgi:hypothetical protein